MGIVRNVPNLPYNLDDKEQLKKYLIEQNMVLKELIGEFNGNISLKNVSIDEVSTSQKGFAPTLPGDATKYLDGTGEYSTPPGGLTGTDGSSSGYFKIGNMLICWENYNVAVSSGTCCKETTKTFPVAFKSGTKPAIVVSGVYAIGGQRVINGYYGESNTGFIHRIESIVGNNFNINESDNFSYLAIGQAD